MKTKIDSTEINGKGIDIVSANEVNNEKKEEVLVFATAVFESTSLQILTQNEANFIERLVFRENHLKQNIVKLDFGPQNCKKLDNKPYKHSLDLNLSVRTSKLWEGPRSYIWKHLGQFEWTQSDGTKVVLNRIHVKS